MDTTAHPHRSKRILIIDDNADASDSLADMLGMLGYTAQASQDRTAALAQARVFQPDVIFLDLGMPHMNGFDLALAMRAHPELAHACIVALTGWNDAATRQRVSIC